VAFTTFGESSAAGMAIGIVYRGIVFWLPFLIGAVLIQMTSTFKGGEQQSGDEVEQSAPEEELAPLHEAAIIDNEAARAAREQGSAIKHVLTKSPRDEAEEFLESMTGKGPGGEDIPD